MKVNTGFEKLSEKQRKSCGLMGYNGPRIREPNEATGPQISKMKGVYVPESWNLRPGAEDHKQYGSVGL